MSADPRARAERQALKTREAVQKNAHVFLPLVREVAATVRKGGRLLLFGEGRLHLLADHCATDVVGRRHRDGSQLPADVLAPSPEGPAATARRIGPFDAVLAVVGDCVDPFFCAVLEAARKRGARVLCICVGRSRLEGRADVAIDVPEPRPHRVAGLVAAVLHYVSKLALHELRASPYVRAHRLDEGPPRRKPEQRTPSPPSPASTPSARLGRVAQARLRGDRPTGSDSVEVSFLEAVIDPEVSEAARLDVAIEPEEGEEEFLPLEESGSYDGVVLREANRVITFRCKRCREPLLAGTDMAGRRGRCPFCDRRVKVPRSGGHPYVAVAPLLAQAGRAVEARAALPEVELTLLPREGAPIAAVLCDVTAEGLEARVPAALAAVFTPGGSLRARVETRAFLEPLLVTLELERIVEAEPGEGGREQVRLLLPLSEEARREERQRLERSRRLECQGV